MPKRYKLTKKYVIVVAYIPKPWIGIVPVVTLAIGLPLAGHSEVTFTINLFFTIDGFPYCLFYRH